MFTWKHLKISTFRKIPGTSISFGMLYASDQLMVIGIAALFRKKQQTSILFQRTTITRVDRSRHPHLHFLMQKDLDNSKGIQKDNRYQGKNTG
ncbi:MAG: hypothetical protein B0W54_08260 [Cellvibrio sp. 79]|nr:MAG: hypothetical protein B0W54_08260 [Cellvibrio sp. 79]